MLSSKQLADICLAGTGSYKACRYLGQDDLDENKFFCIKKTQKKILIDAEIDEYLRQCQKTGNDPRKSNVPCGDNCQGYPILHHIKQGYDQD